MATGFPAFLSLLRGFAVQLGADSRVVCRLCKYRRKICVWLLNGLPRDCTGDQTQNITSLHFIHQPQTISNQTVTKGRPLCGCSASGVTYAAHGMACEKAAGCRACARSPLALSPRFRTTTGGGKNRTLPYPSCGVAAARRQNCGETCRRAAALRT